MDVRGGGEQNESVGSRDEGISSKRRISFEEYEAESEDKRANKSALVEAEEQWTEMETTSGSKYKPKGSGFEDSGSGSESVDTERSFLMSVSGLRIGRAAVEREGGGVL